MSIKITNLTKRFGDQIAVNQLSFDLKDKSVTGFLGPNGAGKSTTMKMMCGLMKPDAGEVELAGLNVLENTLEVKNKIGYLPESNPLYKNLYVMEFLNFVSTLHRHKISRARIQEVVERVGLQPERKKKIGSLSKGYRQRLGLAHAILHDPEVIILDEPMSGLDPNQLMDIRELVRDLGKEKTVIFSSHIMQEVEQVCDRIIILNNGSLVADNTKEEMIALNRPNNIVVLEIRGDVGEKDFMNLEGVSNVIRHDQYHFEIMSNGRKDIREAIHAFSKEKNFSILEMTTRNTNLEHVFQRLTRNQNTSEK